ncbi:MAG: short-chain dehydrogenase [Halioglobus sp.]|nr:short-chain dehydrogenase [Halioglobus sp.]
MLLQDKIVIVSGIGPGLGQHLAARSAAEGAAVVLAARGEEGLERARQHVLDVTPDARLLLVQTDIRDRGQCERLAQQTIDEFGRIDVLINNAYSGGSMGPIEHADMDDWIDTVNTNLVGSMHITQSVIGAMKEQGSGSIVMINTMVVHKPMMYNAGYAASKAALGSASSHLALELGQYGIRVNSLFMGWMHGPNVVAFLEHQASERGIPREEVEAEIAQRISLRRIPTDEECAGAALFMASDYASAVTGANLDVNGGDYLPH